MNEKKQICKQLRREFGVNGWFLLLYFALMNGMVLLVTVADSVIFTAQMLSQGMEQGQIEELLPQRLMSNGWGYLLATAIGALILLAWKKKEFCFQTIWQAKKPMTVGTFLVLVCATLSGQAFFQLTVPLLQFLFGLMGFSLTDFLQSASVGTDTVSMFLYVCLAAPIFEEVLFRGVVLRHLEPYGKKFAILGSAFLFGIFHGNVVQSPYAFVVGLVFGYVAVEYSMVWAMVLHMINNLLLSDTLGRLLQFLPDITQSLILMGIIWGATLIFGIVMLVNRKKVAAWLGTGKMHPWCVGSFFTTAGIVVLTLVLLGNVILALFL